MFLAHNCPFLTKWGNVLNYDRSVKVWYFLTTAFFRYYFILFIRFMDTLMGLNTLNRCFAFGQFLDWWRTNRLVFVNNYNRFVTVMLNRLIFGTKIPASSFRFPFLINQLGGASWSSPVPLFHKLGKKSLHDHRPHRPSMGFYCIKNFICSGLKLMILAFWIHKCLENIILKISIKS